MSYELFFDMDSIRHSLIEEKCAELLSLENFKRTTCATCDNLVDLTYIHSHKFTTDTIRILQVLAVREKDKSSTLYLNNYNCTNFCDDLRYLWLSPKGCTHEHINICTRCFASLSKEIMPKFAIANGLAIGSLPEQFKDVTVIEHAMLNLGHLSCYISSYRGGESNRCIRSHCYVTQCLPGPAITVLPRNIIEEGVFKVSIVGALTSFQQASIRKRYETNGPRIQSLFEFYRKNNSYYTGFSLQLPYHITSIPDMITSHIEDNEDICADLDGDMNRNGMLPTLQVSNNQQSETAKTVGFLMFDASQKEIGVWKTNQFMPYYLNSFFTKSFVELFPFGRGGYEEVRQIKLTLHEYILNCLRLSGQRYVIC
jgi:hypothetical protein